MRDSGSACELLPSRWARRAFPARSWPVLLVLFVCASAIPPQPAAAAGGVGRELTSSIIPKDSSLTFPVTPVGQTSTLCTDVCYCSDVNACTCDRSGTITLNHDLSSPFSAYGYTVETAGFTDDCSGGSPVQLPVFLDVGQKLVYTVSFSPTSIGTFNDYLELSTYTLSLSGPTPLGSPSLVPYQPTGWSAPVVVSNTPGTQVDSPNLSSTDSLYVSWAVINDGDLSTFGTFYIDLYLDGAFLQRWHYDPSLPPGYYISIKDYKVGPLATGSHTLELVPDSTNTIGESTTYTKPFAITAALPSKPTTTTSWYVMAKNLKDSALYAWAYQAGQQAGQLNARSGDAQFVLLDFGEPWVAGRGTFGTGGFGRFLSVTKIANVVRQFVLGYETVTQFGLFLAVGTTNQGPYVTAAHGQAWAKLLVDLDSWRISNGYDVHFQGASDIEVGFSPSPQPAQAWLQAFADEITANGIDYVFTYDYGDAGGCPRTGTTSTPGPCNNGWNQGDIADLLALYAPEIYNRATAHEWQQISLFTDLRSGQTGSTIEVPLSERQACQQRGGCAGINNTPLQAWNQLVAALNGDPITAPGLSGLLWSTDIKWNQ